VPRGLHCISRIRASSGPGAASGGRGEVAHTGKTGARAFSLIEGLLSIILLGLILIGAAPFFSYGVLLIQRSSLRREAAELTAGKLEEMLDEGFYRLEAQQTEQTVDLGGISGTMTWRVEDTHIDAYGRGYKLVAVTVSWSFGDKTDIVSAATYVSSPWSTR